MDLLISRVILFLILLNIPGFNGSGISGSWVLPALYIQVLFTAGFNIALAPCT